MVNLRQLALLFAALAALSACSTSRGQTVNSDNQPGVAQPVADSGAGVSKYSPQQHVWTSDPDRKGEEIRSSDPQLPKQYDYTSPNPRSSLIDHYIDNTPPEHIPLINWKFDFIAGELALDALDMQEAERCFRLSLLEAGKEKGDAAVIHRTMTNVRLAYIARKNNDLVGAERLYADALPVLQRDPVENAKALHVALSELALICWKQQRFADAQKYLEEHLKAAKAETGAISVPVASAMNELANCLFYQKKFSEADKLYMQGLVITDRFTEDSSASPTAANNLANCRLMEQRYADALALYNRAGERRYVKEKIELCEQELAKLPASKRVPRDIPPPIGNADIWREFMEAGKDDLAHDRNWYAQRVLKAALQEAHALKKPAFVAETNLALADRDFQEGQFSNAIASYKQALGAGEALPASVVASAHARFLLCQLTQKDYSGAAKSLKVAKSAPPAAGVWRGLTPIIHSLFVKRRLSSSNDESFVDLLDTVCEQCVAQAPPKTNEKAIALANRAQVLSLGRRMQHAEPLFQEALTTAQHAVPKDDELIAAIETQYGVMCMTDTQFKKGEPLLLAALAYRENHPGKDNEKLREQIYWVQCLYNNWRRPDDEEVYYKRLMAVRPATIPSFQSRESVSDLSNLARINMARCDYESAAKYLEESQRLQAADRNTGSSGDSFRDLVTCYQTLGDYKNLERTYDRATNIPGANPSDRAVMQNNYLAAKAAFNNGDYTESATRVGLVLSTMERMGERADKDFGCYAEEPRITACFTLLGNCILDGERNYDKAISVFDKGLKSNQCDTGTERRTVPGIGGAAPKVYLTAEQLVNMLICTDAIGNVARADEYRKELKRRVTMAGGTPAQQESVVRDADHIKAVALIDKSKRSRAEEIELMEFVPKAAPKTLLASTNADDLCALLQRAIVLRIKSGDANKNEAIADDYAQLVMIALSSSSRYSLALPAALQQLRWLSSNGGTPQQIALARIDYADALKEAGHWTIAKRTYLAVLPTFSPLPTTEQFRLYKNIVFCCDMLEEYEDSLKYSKDALKLATADSPEWRRELVYQACIEDVLGRHAEAQVLYTKACAGLTNVYDALEPLRTMADRLGHEKKRYVIAHYLYQRQLQLLEGHSPGSLPQVSVWMQMGRMYRWAKMPVESGKAYQHAIALCKAQDADSSTKQMVTSAEQELSDMLKQN